MLTRLTLFSLVCLSYATPALAEWGDNWGEMVWGLPVSGPAVPSLPGVGLILLALALSTTAAWRLRKRRTALGLPVLLVLLAIPLVVAAGPLSIPNWFVNGEVADADEINANFDAIATEVNDNDSRLSEVEADTSGNTYGVIDNAAAIEAEEIRASYAEATNAASISGETDARIAADAAHDTAIAANATAISAESTARIAGDSSLDTRLDAVESGSFPGGLQLDTQLVLDDDAIGSPVSIAAGSGAMVIQDSNFTSELRLGRGFNGNAIQAGTTIGTTSNLLLNPHGGDVELGDGASEITVAGQALVEGGLEVGGDLAVGGDVLVGTSVAEGLNFNAASNHNGSSPSTNWQIAAGPGSGPGAADLMISAQDEMYFHISTYAANTSNFHWRSNLATTNIMSLSETGDLTVTGEIQAHTIDVDGIDVDGTFDATASVTGTPSTTVPNDGTDHVMLIHNTANSGNDAAHGVLAIKSGRDAAEASVNFITFYDANEAVGAIEGIAGGGGVSLDTTAADMSEWMERIDHAQAMEPGDIVSVIGGKITRDTRDAFQLQVVSTAPFVAGNAPSQAEKVQWERIAFIGQVPVRVRGRVEVGDYILPSGHNDGTGTARRPAEMDWSDYSLVVGRASEGSEETQLKKVRTVVGLEPRLPQRLMSQLQRQRAANRELEQRIARLEGLLSGRGNSLTSLGSTH